MRIDTGIDALDTFWITIKNRKGNPIVSGGGEFAIELYSPFSPEMVALKNLQLDKGEIARLKLRKVLKDEGILGQPEAVEDRIWQFMEQSLHATANDTAVAAVKSWRNFPRIIDPVTRKPLEPQPPVPECTRENVQNLFAENPDILKQVQEGFNDEKNYLMEPDENSSTSSSVSSAQKPDSISPKEIPVSPQGNTSEPPMPPTRE